LIVVGGCIETERDVAGKTVPGGNCFRRAVMYLCW
jgi:hypothetical protein